MKTSFLDRVAAAVTPLAVKFSNQRHLASVRDGFIALMPLVIVGSIMVLINNVLLSNTQGGIWGPGSPLEGLADLTAFKEIGVRIYTGTLDIMGLLIVYTISYKLSATYGEDGFIPGLVAVGSFIAMIPLTQAIILSPEQLASGTLDVANLNTVYLSAVGMFVAIAVSLIATEILLRLSRIKALIIKMPESVPPAVARSFNIMVPTLITLGIFAIVAFLLNYFWQTDIFTLINLAIKTPVQALFQGLPGIFLVMFLQNFLWAFGIHGAFILSPITEPTLLEALTANATAISQGLPALNIVTKPFIDAFVLIGGGGTTIGLLIALFIFSKREDHKAIAKLAAAPGLFNINEPLMFGLPVVLNPIYMIPVVIAPLVNLCIAYFATLIGLVEKTYVMTPWTTPPVISAFLATGGDWKAAVLAVLLIGVATLIYIPFVIIGNKVDQTVEAE
ncbi:PTS sugar transporter subunit IIC [Culicoidibacter larvae]|uniref:Permease IIC component n=1 Tax=Culicoidibacter larvae TaxID=2579976 RepID=A0A5R8QEG8_9FIRM|nr:PTS transporter subunit EIIC [Culicoidibacter larvae]TLG75420.1 PTS sugar transporter subunit IIC [Culicoidibacter larvae]